MALLVVAFFAEPTVEGWVMTSSRVEVLHKPSYLVTYPGVGPNRFGGAPTAAGLVWQSLGWKTKAGLVNVMALQRSPGALPSDGWGEYPESDARPLSQAELRRIAGSTLRQPMAMFTNGVDTDIDVAVRDVNGDGSEEVCLVIRYDNGKTDTTDVSVYGVAGRQVRLVKAYRIDDSSPWRKFLPPPPRSFDDLMRLR